MKPSAIAVFLVAFSGSPQGVAGQAWQQMGPAPIEGSGFSNLPNATVSGIITDIAIDPSGSTDSTIYIATGGGGIWKTTNGGSSWNPTTDSMPILTMGAVALDPANPSIVYAGVGGPYCCFAGGGIYKSTDGAGNWQAVNPNHIFAGLSIARIVLPASGTLLVATNNGLYKSVDGGVSFGNNSPTFNNSSPIPITTPGGSISNGNISDLRADTSTLGTVYAAIDGQGIFKSTDSGTTFPASGLVLGSASFPPAVTVTSDVYIKIAQSTQPNNLTMYAFLCNGTSSLNNTPTGEPCALLKSANGGASFSAISLASAISINQQDYDQIVGVDPQNANNVYIGLRQLYFASDGGKSGFSSNSQIDKNSSHVDEHAIAFSPSSHYTGPPTRVYIGSDGGFSSTATQGSAPGSQWQFLNQQLATTLLYDIDIGRGSTANNVYTYGAFQDNGISVATPANAGTQQWNFQCCGDGNDIAVDPSNPLHALGVNDGGIQNTTDGQHWGSPTFPANPPSISFVRFDPSGGAAYAAGTYKTGSSGLFQSTDNGSTFSLMHSFNKSISALSLVKGNKNLIWVGFSDGTLQKTTNALQGSSSTWTGVTVTGAPSNQSVNGIAIDPTDNSTVVVVYPGFSGAADPPQHVFLTGDSGATWANIGGTANGGDNNIPDIPLNAVVIVPTTTPHAIVVGSDIGVMQTADGNTWQVLGTGLPNAKVTGLAIDTTANPLVLRASTFGRSAFKLQGACVLCPPAPQCQSTGCVGPSYWQFSASCSGIDAGIVYNGNCTDNYGESRPCYAGFSNASSAQVSWAGGPGPPLWETASSQNTYQSCSTSAAGEDNCVSITIPLQSLPVCPSGPSPPPPLCPDGEKWCLKFSPPRCVPINDCLVQPVKPPNQ